MLKYIVKPTIRDHINWLKTLGHMQKETVKIMEQQVEFISKLHEMASHKRIFLPNEAKFLKEVCAYLKGARK